MGFIFYDTETTGFKTSFDQILQFAAIHTDDNLEVLDEINLRCRRLPHIVPSPGALLATRISIDQMEGADLTHYRMTQQLLAWLKERSPAIFIGYNSMRFDERLLRQALYQTLQPTYVTNTNGNYRGDLMFIVQAAAAYAPDRITIPRDDKGRYVFKLGEVARANGISLPEEQAHEAMADVRATLELARFVRRNSPEIWEAMLSNARKPEVNGFVEREQVLCLSAFYYGRPYSYVVALAARNADDENEIALFDLAHEPTNYLGLDVPGLVAALERSPKVFRTARVNGQPILMPYAMCPAEIRGTALDAPTYRSRAEAVRNDGTFRDNLARALSERWPKEEASPYVEARIYDGFASPADQALMGQFHSVPWSERDAICNTFGDERFTELGRKLVYFEEPSALPGEQRAEFERWVASRLHAEEDVPWTTIPKALQDVEDLRRRRPEADTQLREIREFLLALAEKFPPP